MISLQVVAIDQRYVFGAKGNQLQNYVVLELPDGGEVRASIDDDTAKRLLLLDAEASDADGGLEPLRKQVAPVVPQPLFNPPESVVDYSTPLSVELPAEADVSAVAWMELPDEVLSPAMKAAFHHLGIEEKLVPVAIRSIEREVMDKFGSVEWEEVLGPSWAEYVTGPQPAPPPPPTPQAQPPIGQVSWADGSPMVPGTSRRARTVPKDSFGYPILNDGTVDPGEVLGGSDPDEDGVSSL